jgi:hypothetical protein
MDVTDVTPFSVHTPETLAARDAVDLFVDLFTQVEAIRAPGHAMLNGPRGCGKSMLFRFLTPDCQLLHSGKPLAELPFFAVLVSLKNPGLNIPELGRFGDRAYTNVLNEHFLTVFVASQFFATLAALEIDTEAVAAEQLAGVAAKTLGRLRKAGWRGEDPDLSARPGVVLEMQLLFDEMFHSMTRTLRNFAFNPDLASSYSGEITGFSDVLLPLFRDLRSLPCMPNGPVYLLMDDADSLNYAQTRVLNSWVATRSNKDVSIKISTQYKYKTFQAGYGMSIEAPHDFAELDAADLYTTEHSQYKQRVEKIVEKRLARAGISASPYDFFPEHRRQKAILEKIARQIRDRWEEEGRGFRPSDDVLRYARPTYIASLGRAKKSTHRYSYAGFEQLVHISSGVVRYFLDAASQMYALQQTAKPDEPVSSIPAHIQDDVVREASDRMMFEEFDRLVEDEEGSELHDEAKRALLRDRKRLLHNLIRVLGNVFYWKLVSDDAERRVFSVAFSDQPDDSLLTIFDLGIKAGYFHRSAIGNKQGTGRTRLYVLTRRLAPHFRLDPTGFAGYLWVMSDRIWEGIRDPDAFLRRIKDEGVDRYFEPRQLELFSSQGASPGSAQ